MKRGCFNSPYHRPIKGRELRANWCATHALAHSIQYQKIKLTVAPENEPALRLYQSEGFQLIDSERNYFGDGEERLVMVYQRESTA
ncbi:GNAT family N-acetyltransferase [Vibrio navarrensis]|uniref:GNAT family N-acetyltransferase n=1 Tax=Vibrio navarrensis TaxID=29495 RepID=UPI001D04E789|nr:hypothetical protein [Vibrio navarrensis]